MTELTETEIERSLACIPSRERGPMGARAPRWICAVVACSAPEGHPHDPACPYATQPEERA